MADGCWYCGKAFDELQFQCGSSATTNSTVWDHIVPHGRGGKDEYENLIPACYSCNSTKKMKTLSEFRASLRQDGLYADFPTSDPQTVYGILYDDSSFVSDDGTIILESILLRVAPIVRALK